MGRVSAFVQHFFDVHETDVQLPLNMTKPNKKTRKARRDAGFREVCAFEISSYSHKAFYEV